MLSIKRDNELLSVGFFSALLLSGTVFIFTPIDIFVSNSDWVQANIRDVLLEGFLLILLFTTSVVFILCILPQGALEYILCYVLVVLGIVAWVNSTWLFGKYGEIDGRGLIIESWSLLSFAQITFIFTVSLSTALLLRKRVVVRNVVLACVLTGAASTAFSLFQSTLLDIGKPSPKKDRHTAYPASFSGFSNNHENLVLLILDELQMDSFLYALELKPQLREKLDGFRLFRDTTANFPTTLASIPAILSGEIYQNDQPWRQFLRNIVEEGSALPNYLSDRGVDVSGLGVGWYSEMFPEGCCIEPAEVAVAAELWLDRSYLELLDLSLFRSFPDVGKNLIYNNENWFLRRHIATDPYDAIGHSGLHHKLLEKFVEEIHSVSTDSPTFRYFHSVITHAPIMLNENCEPLDEAAPSNIENAAREGLCALTHVENLLKKLKAENIYDSTMLILASDHGSRSFYSQAVKSTSDDSSLGPVYAGAAALLLVKPYNSKGSMKTAHYPAALSDVPATIAPRFSGDSWHTGVDLLSTKKPMRRIRYFNDYHWSKEYHDLSQEKAPPMNRYAMSGPVYELDSWSLEDFSIGANVGPLPCGETLRFGDAMSKDYYASHGLSVLEKGGRWSVGKDVRIKLRFPDIECPRGQLILRLSPFLYADLTYQKARVFVNGTYFRELEGVSGKEISLLIDSQKLELGGEIEVRFEIDTHTTPKSLGLNSDSRSLGFRFIDITLD